MLKFISFLALTAIFSCHNSERIKRFQDQQMIKIAVIPMGSSHNYWTQCREGALQAGKELDVEIIWQGPQKEDDAQMQVNVFNSIIQNGIDGIVLAPIDGKIILPSLEMAQKKQIPVICIDSEMEESYNQGFVGTENFEAGRLCGTKMAELLKAKGKVAIFQLKKKVKSTAERETGFLAALKGFPEIKVSKTRFYAGPTAEMAKNEALQLLQNQPDINGIFTVNENTTVGMMLALRELKWTGKKHFVGFDSNPKVVEALKSGEIEAIAVQNPYQMGYIGVKNAFAATKGEGYSKKVDTKISLINRDSLISKQIQTKEKQ
jgi:ribose transport system substrate-binding protein